MDGYYLTEDRDYLIAIKDGDYLTSPYYVGDYLTTS